jgi:hypothetical protein
MKKFIVEYLDWNNFRCSEIFEGEDKEQLQLKLHKDYDDISITSIKEIGENKYEKI